MTTNSPNPVDGDVQALIEDCRRAIDKIEKSLASNNDNPMSFSEKHLLSELARQQIALASLTAEPCAFLYGASFERGEVEGEIEDSPGTDMPVFNTHPAQLLRPVELPEPYDDGHGNLWLPQDAVISAVKNAGGEVKS